MSLPKVIINGVEWVPKECCEHKTIQVADGEPLSSSRHCTCKCHLPLTETHILEPKETKPFWKRNKRREGTEHLTYTTKDGEGIGGKLEGPKCHKEKFRVDESFFRRPRFTYHDPDVKPEEPKCGSQCPIIGVTVKNGRKVGVCAEHGVQEPKPECGHYGRRPINSEGPFFCMDCKTMVYDTCTKSEPKESEEPKPECECPCHVGTSIIECDLSHSCATEIARYDLIEMLRKFPKEPEKCECGAVIHAGNIHSGFACKTFNEKNSRDYYTKEEEKEFRKELLDSLGSSFDLEYVRKKFL